MRITGIRIYKYSIPMVPFTIASGTMAYAQNILIKIDTDAFTGVGECSAFPMITGETQATCFEMAQDFARLWKNKDALDIEARMNELHAFAAGNSTIKSAFDMALYDIAAQQASLPLYRYLGGQQKKLLQSDITIGIQPPAAMAAQAEKFVQQGASILKIKLGKCVDDDIEAVQRIAAQVGNAIPLRLDANQGWRYDEAVKALNAFATLNIEFCEQPMHRHYDALAPKLKKEVPIKIMADESAFDHHDATRLIDAGACDYVNIKFAKSGGILEAIKISEACSARQVACMMGGMLESRVALTAFAHFAAAFDNVCFYDMDTCLLGHLEDPVNGGVTYHRFALELPEAAGIGAAVDEAYLEKLVWVEI